MYTIRQAAARTGLNVPTIRAWERRYGVVRPSRTAAGYRLYDDDSIARLLAMRRLVDGDGWRPSQAADRVIAVRDSADLAALGREPDRSVAPEAGPERDGESGTAADLIDAFRTAASLFDIPAIEEVLDGAFAAQRFESAMRDVVFPALRELGEGWSSGEIDVAAEHAASETVRRRLSQLFEAAGRSVAGPTVLVGLPPGSHHEIGAFAFAIAARRAGLRVLYLGADVPLESWLRTARETEAPLAVLAVVTLADVAPATLVAEGLRTLTRPPRCFLGGALAHTITVTDGMAWLPDSLDEAVARVADAARAPAA